MRHSCLRLFVVCVLAGASGALTGCAEVKLIADTAVLIANHVSEKPPLVEVTKLPLSDPPEAVYEALVASVARDGRQIVEQDAATQTVRASYPGTWKRWAGSLTIKITADERATLVTILGERKDPEVRKVADAVLDDLAVALRRQPRSL